MPSDSDDLALINSVLQFYPEVNALVRTVKRVSARTEYPVASFSELTDAAGDGGEEVPADEGLSPQERAASVLGLPHGMPAYYFPIASQDDLIAKLLELRAKPSPAQEPRHRGGIAETLRMTAPPPTVLPSPSPIPEPQPLPEGPGVPEAPPMPSQSA
jgi:hypothetical protein